LPEIMRGSKTNLIVAAVVIVIIIFLAVIFVKRINRNNKENVSGNEN
jgi:regulatory protein YycI of two-component signal transduction system YycFG